MAILVDMSHRTRTEGFALRWTPEESARIRERAAAAGMPVGPYLIACALGDVDETPTVEQRLDELAERLERLERAAKGAPLLAPQESRTAETP